MSLTQALFKWLLQPSSHSHLLALPEVTPLAFNAKFSESSCSWCKDSLARDLNVGLRPLPFCRESLQLYLSFFFFFWWVTHLGVWHFSILCLLLPISFFILLLWGKFLLVFRSYSSVAALYFGVPMWGSELGSSYSAMLTTASYMSAFISKPYCWDYSHSYEVCFRIRNKKPWNLFFLKTTWLFEFPWDFIWILGWIFLFLHKKHFVILIGIGWIHRSS